MHIMLKSKNQSPKMKLIDSIQTQLFLFQTAVETNLLFALQDSKGDLNVLAQKDLLSYSEISIRLEYVKGIQYFLKSTFNSCLKGLGYETDEEDFFGEDEDTDYIEDIEYYLSEAEKFIYVLPDWLLLHIDRMPDIKKEGDQMFADIFKGAKMHSIVDGEMVEVSDNDVAEQQLQEYLSNLELSDIVNTWTDCMNNIKALLETDDLSDSDIFKNILKNL